MINESRMTWLTLADSASALTPAGFEKDRRVLTNI